MIKNKRYLLLPGVGRNLIPVFSALAVTLGHSICCLLPVFASFTVSLSHWTVLESAKPYLLGLQVLMLGYALYRVLEGKKHAAPVRIYGVSALISLIGIGVAISEPPKTEQQEQTIRILENLRHQQNLTLVFQAPPDFYAIQRDLMEIEGVRWKKTVAEDNQVTIHYHSGEVSERKIVTVLARNGYRFQKLL